MILEFLIRHFVDIILIGILIYICLKNRDFIIKMFNKLKTRKNEKSNSSS